MNITEKFEKIGARAKVHSGRPGYQNGFFLERIARALEVDVESIYPTVEGEL